LLHGHIERRERSRFERAWIVPDSPVSDSITSRAQKPTTHSTTRHESVSERLSVENTPAP
jgi:hypothetical protein